MVTKIHMLLQAASNSQAYRKRLRSHAQIRLLEQGKFGTQSDNTLRSGMPYKALVLRAFYSNESGGTSVESVVMTEEQ